MSEQTIPCISLWQPWASWVALGWKVIETRTHRRFVALAGKVIGIHAAQKWDRAAFDIARPFLTREQLDVPHRLYDARGAVLCTALVDHEDALDATHAPAALIECESVQRWGLFLAGLRRFEKPITARGGQGIFYLPAEALAAAKPIELP